MPTSLLASIPSPGSGSIDLGPLTLRAYGVMIALGVLAAVEIGRRRWAARGYDPDDITAIATWAVPAGLIGSRIYHVITDWKSFRGRWLDVFAIWQGGLGIPGGLVAGIGVGLWVTHRRGLSVPDAIDACIPGIPVAQAIGRLGNWFNQELYGKPSDLPWALEIDLAHRHPPHLDVETFHPTFLYEGLWNLALFGVLVLIDRRRVLKPGRLLAVYVFGYGLGRLWVETLRIDHASLLLGVRVNVWTSLFAMLVAGGFLLVSGRRADHAGRPGLVDQPDRVAQDTDAPGRPII
ncbi:MAG: prolipoprotein diacylglyceryl transferase [Actinomycetia bacterium]|nr:prolipoprotein diacylglyceryl transferase [Actinomycetes bacterium]